MLHKNLEIFNRNYVFIIIFSLSVHFTLARADTQDSLNSVRDSLLLELDETSQQESTNDMVRNEIYKSIVDVDTRIIRMQNDTFTYNINEYKKSLSEVNKKLDQVNERRVKLERTVLILILVLMMLTYYVYKLQQKNIAKKE